MVGFTAQLKNNGFISSDLFLLVLDCHLKNPIKMARTHWLPVWNTHLRSVKTSILASYIYLAKTSLKELFLPASFSENSFEFLENEQRQPRSICIT